MLSMMKPLKYPFWISNKHFGCAIGCVFFQGAGGSFAISIHIRKLIYRGKWAYCSSHLSPIASRISVSGELVHPTLPQQYSSRTTTSAAPLCPLPSLVIQFDPVFPSMQVRDFIQWGRDLFSPFCVTQHLALNPREGTSACELY